MVGNYLQIISDLNIMLTWFHDTVDIPQKTKSNISPQELKKLIFKKNNNIDLYIKGLYSLTLHHKLTDNNTWTNVEVKITHTGGLSMSKTIQVRLPRSTERIIQESIEMSQLVAYFTDVTLPQQRTSIINTLQLYTLLNKGNIKTYVTDKMHSFTILAGQVLTDNNTPTKIRIRVAHKNNIYEQTINIMVTLPKSITKEFNSITSSDLIWISADKTKTTSEITNYGTPRIWVVSAKLRINITFYLSMILDGKLQIQAIIYTRDGLYKSIYKMIDGFKKDLIVIN